MTTAPSTPDRDDSADGPDGWLRLRLDHQLAELDRLAALGMGLAEAIAGPATADPGAVDPVRVARAFGLAARAVRLTHALQARLIADFRARPARAAGTPAPVARRLSWMDSEIETLDEDRPERLLGEARERPETDDIWTLVRTRPVDEIIAMICRDLGVDPDDWRGAETPGAQDEIVRRVAHTAFIPPPPRPGFARPPPFRGSS